MASAFDSKIELDQATAQAVRSPANGSHRLARVAGSPAFFKEELPHFSSPPGHLFGSDDISEESSEGSCTSENPIRVDPTTGLNHLGELIEEAECALGLLHLVSSGSVEESAHRPTFSRSDFVGDPASSFEDSQSAACAFLRERMVTAECRVAKLSRIIEKLERERQAARNELADAEVVIQFLENSW